MAKIAKKRKSAKGDPPPKTDASDTLNNPDPEQPVRLSFTVPLSLRREYKTYSSEHNVSMLEVLKRSFNLLKNKKP